MTEELNIMIKEYAKNPINNFTMKDFTVKQHEGNFICWDDITIYLKIENNIILEYSFDGNCSTITTAASSFLSEFIIWKSLDEVLSWNYQTMLDKWFEVSNRRRRAAVIAILGVRNAIHKYLSDWKEDSFDDIILD